MSTPATETKPAEEQQVPTAEVKQESETTTTTTSSEASAEPSSAGAEPSSMEVDASNTEMKTEAASGEEVKADADAKPAEGAKAEDAKAKPNRQFRLNASARKRFKWLLDQGYSKEEAAELAKEPLKTKELRDRFNADTKKTPKPKDEKVIEAEVKKLSPGDKKKFSWLLQNGHTEQEALEVIQKQRNTAPKRNLPMAVGGPPMKMSRPQPVDGQAPSLSMAVVPKEFPDKTLTHVQSNEVKAAILKEVVQQKDSETKPRFESCAHVKTGYLRVICSDGPTRQWLHKIVNKLGVPEGVQLKMVNEKNLLKGDIFTGVFPDSKKETNEAILEFVKSQNEGLNISQWKVISRKEPPSKQLVELMFSVDQASARAIQKLANNLNYKFNKVHLQKQAKPGDSQRPVANNRNIVARPGGAGGRPMGPPQRRPVVNQPRPTSNSFVSVWDNNRNLPQKSNYNQFDSMRSNSFSSAGGNTWGTGNALNTFGLGSLGGMDSSYGSSNPFGGSGSYGTRNNSFGGSDSFGTGNNSFGGSSSSYGNGNNSFGGSNSYGNGNNSFERGSNSFGSAGSNLFSRRNVGGGGRSNGGGQSGGSNRSFNLADSLYDQLKLIGSSGALGNNSNGFGSPRRTGGGGGGGSGGAGSAGNNGLPSRRSGGNNNNSRARNPVNAGGSGGKVASSRSLNLGKRNFFTTTRTGFF